MHKLDHPRKEICKNLFTDLLIYRFIKVIKFFSFENLKFSSSNFEKKAVTHYQLPVAMRYHKLFK